MGLTEVSDGPFRRRCRWFALIVRAAAAGLAALAVIAALLPFLGLADSRPSPSAAVLMRLLPALFYIAALWSLASVFAGLARGESFGSLVTRGLRRVGLALLAGALTSIVGVIAVNRAITGAGSYIHLDVPGIVLACVGLGLVLLARLVESAGEIAAELDEMI